jgi:hypothetical protein
MKPKKISFLIFFSLFQIIYSQIATFPDEYQNFLNQETRQVYNLWNLYLNKKGGNDSTAIALWNPEEVKQYKAYDIFESSSQFSPSLYQLDLTNQLSYIKEIDKNKYLLSSHYYWIDDNKLLHFYLTQNIIIKKINGRYYLSNYLLEATKNWKQKKVGLINYRYPVGYKLNTKRAEKANQILNHINTLFDLKSQNIDYYISSDCSQSADIIGMRDEIIHNTLQRCGAYDMPNKIIFATDYDGEDYRHELIHVINEKYSNAHYLLLTGLAIYSNDADVHLGQSFQYIFEKLNQYSEKNPDIQLNFTDDFPKFSQNIGSEYAFGAIFIDMILEKGGINSLKAALTQIKNDDDLMSFVRNDLQINDNELSNIIKAKVKELSKKDFNFKIKL